MEYLLTFLTGLIFLILKHWECKIISYCLFSVKHPHIHIHILTKNNKMNHFNRASVDVKLLSYCVVRGSTYNVHTGWNYWEISFWYLLLEIPWRPIQSRVVFLSLLLWKTPYLHTQMWMRISFKWACTTSDLIYGCENIPHLQTK